MPKSSIGGFVIAPRIQWKIANNAVHLRIAMCLIFWINLHLVMVYWFPMISSPMQKVHTPITTAGA
jgi:hypothetical protein